MPDIALDLRFLHYAILVARLGSFSAVAESLDLSHTTVNRRVSLLERRLGFQIFERDATGAHLTAAGAKFVEDAERGMSTLLRAVNSARNFQKGATGVLRIGVMTSLSGGFLAELLNAFHARYPEVEFEINEITSESGVTGVLWGHLDLAFLPQTENIAGCMVIHLWQERVHLAVPEGHHLSSSSRVTWDELRAEHFLVPCGNAGAELDKRYLEQLSKSGPSPKISIHDVGRENLLSLVGHGCGVALVLSSSMHSQHAGVRFLPIGDPPEFTSFSAVCLSKNQSVPLKNLMNQAQAHTRVGGGPNK
ncbi:LysR family transcriptional regulator [Paracoccus pantotrophus]|uniref:LysR family transcriptional regulator n=1 Tax=Paracoccus pantotrophus TaxID=82367 RepID=A0A7H9BP19_PARPN|nr:LysR family transcriptional regulator [Paracoccus pantotrophus]QLH13057.1 LysR family transcriptional regulator [Paracoccus pantotrophus]